MQEVASIPLTDSLFAIALSAVSVVRMSSLPPAVCIIHLLTSQSTVRPPIRPWKPESIGDAQNLKRRPSWRDEYLKWICGFANAQGGILEIGKDDRGEIIGVNDPLRLLEDIPNKAQSLLGIVVDVNLKTGGGGEYLEIRVDPYPHPISYKGEYHYRSGSTKQVLRGAALNRFLLQKYGRNWDDAPMPGVGMRDLEGRTLDEFRRRGIASGRLPAYMLNETDSNLIDMLHLRDGEHLRRAAILLFHPDPARFFAGAFLKIGYFRTETDLAYQDIVEGNLFAQVDRTVDLLRTKYSKAEISYDGIYRRETPPTPGAALREAVLNAVAHRDYGNSAPIQIRVYDDRISLWNPRSLPADWTIDKLLGTHASAPQNPGIANTFFRAGMVEAWGRGIAHIVRTCRAAGTVEPKWMIEPGGVRLEFVLARKDSPLLSHNTVRQATDRYPDSRQEPDNLAHDSGRREQPRPESQPESLANRVLQQLSDGPMSKAELSKSFGQAKISGQLNKVVKLLIVEGKVEYTIPEKPQSRLQRYRLTGK